MFYTSNTRRIILSIEYNVKKIELFYKKI